MKRRTKDEGPRRIGEGLNTVVGRLGDGRTGGSASTLGMVFGHWEEIAGPAMSAHVWPLRLSGDVLTVAVDNPAWATQVRALSSELLDQVRNKCGGELTRIEVTVRRS